MKIGSLKAYHVRLTAARFPLRHEREPTATEADLTVSLVNSGDSRPSDIRSQLNGIEPEWTGLKPFRPRRGLADY